MIWRLTIHVKPRSKQPGIEKQSATVWIVRVPSAPVDGKANDAVIEMLAADLRVRKSQIRIVTGLKSRKKIVEIDG